MPDLVHVPLTMWDDCPIAPASPQPAADGGDGGTAGPGGDFYDDGDEQFGDGPGVFQPSAPPLLPTVLSASPEKQLSVTSVGSPLAADSVVSPGSWPAEDQQPDPKMVSLSEGKLFSDTTWQEETLQQDYKLVLGVGAGPVMYQAGIWCCDEEKTCGISGNSHNGSSNGASCNEETLDVPWSGTPTHPFDRGKDSPGSVWRRGSVRGVERPLDRGRDPAVVA